MFGPPDGRFFRLAHDGGLAAPRRKDIGASLTMAILIYAGFNLVAALIPYPAGSLSDKLDRRNILIVAFAIFFVTYLDIAVTRNIALIAVLFIFYGLYQGIFRSVGKALASDYVPEQLRASGIGWYNTIVGLFGLMASLIAGWLWDQVGHAAVFLFGAGLAMVGGIVLLALVPENAGMMRELRRECWRASRSTH
ncbi:MAG TPA: MFS transporter [Candidatus Acidoferrales bacterium]|jgi:MFS family permease|nr:MFS transporter [Candidatus Acidoferrales bacterium]